MRFNKRNKGEKYDPFSIREGRFGGLNDFSYRLQWTEDSFVAGGEGKETIGRAFDLKKIYPLAAVMSVLIFVLFAKSAWLQIVKKDYYYSMAEGNRIRVERIEAKRGIIYDRRNNPLVRNVANFLLYVIPADLPAEENARAVTIEEIATILGDERETEIKEAIMRIEPKSLEAYQPFFIADNIEYEKAMLLYLKSSQWQGVVLSNKTRRDYDLSSLSLSHILGYTGKISEEELKKAGNEYSPIDYIGKTGIENFWESELKGTSGKKQIEVDAMGREKKIASQIEAEDGRNLVLAVDLGLQKKMEEVIVKARMKKGAALAIDPASGEILAMASFPLYDNNIFARGITAKEYEEIIGNPDKPLFNKAVSGEYPSGSTIKPVMAAAALEEGVINEYTSFMSVGGIKINEWFFPDWKAGGHGATNVRKAIAESVNTFFYYIGGGFRDFKGLGVDRIVRYGKLFGLGQEMGIDLTGEASGFLPTKEWKENEKGERWYIGDTYHMAIGQGDLLVTPLQVAAFTAVFANGGSLYRPHLVRQILSSDDKVIKEIKEEPVRKNFISENNIEIVRQGMRQTVTAGSARSLSDLPVAAAGKTGTAQWSTKKPPHAWFTGFAPYDNPQIVITVLVEEGGEGSSAAVPIAKEILEWYFRDNK